MSGSATGRAAATCTRMHDIPVWLARVRGRFATPSARLCAAARNDAGKPLVLVHGDTMTTVLGALMGRAARASPSRTSKGGFAPWIFFHPFPGGAEPAARVEDRADPLRAGPWRGRESQARRGRRHGHRTRFATASHLLAVGGSADPGARRDHVRPRQPAPVRAPQGRAAPARDARAARRARAARAPLLFIDHPVTVAAHRALRPRRSLRRRGFVRDPAASTSSGSCELAARRARSSSPTAAAARWSRSISTYRALFTGRRSSSREGLGENVVVSGFVDR